MSLPLEVIELIALSDERAWKSLLALPFFGRHSLNPLTQFVAEKRFAKVMKLSSHGNLEEHHFVARSHHRRDGPAYAKVNPEGKYTEGWCIRGKLHRDGDMPALTSFCKDETTKAWYRNGKEHREGGKPCFVFRNKEYTLKEWKVDGKRTEKGPFMVLTTRHGEKRFFLKGTTEEVHVYNNEGLLLFKAFFSDSENRGSNEACLYKYSSGVELVEKKAFLRGDDLIRQWF